MIRFETDRCVIREFLAKDIDFFMRYRNDEKWMIYQTFKGLSKKEYEDILLSCSSIEEGMQLAITNKNTDKIIGDLYIKKNKQDGSFSIGYTISPLYARQGYTYEATMALIEWIKKEGASKIYGNVLSDNHASIHLLEKIGFEFLEKNDENEEVWIYNLD